MSNFEVVRKLLGGVWYYADNTYGQYSSWIRPSERDERHSIVMREEFANQYWTNISKNTESPEFTMYLLLLK